jgi:hypothetical protein
VPLDPQRTDSPTAMPVVLTTPGQAAGLVVQLTVTTPWPALAALLPRARSRGACANASA